MRWRKGVVELFGALVLFVAAVLWFTAAFGVWEWLGGPRPEFLADVGPPLTGQEITFGAVMAGLATILGAWLDWLAKRRKVAGGVLGVAAGLLLGLCVLTWIGVPVLWVMGEGLPSLEEIGYMAVGTVTLAALAGVLYWLGKRLELSLSDKDPDRLSFLHAVRVVRRRLPLFAALPPRAGSALHGAVLAEILEERVASSRDRRVPRGVKRKMSGPPAKTSGYLVEMWPALVALTGGRRR